MTRQRLQVRAHSRRREAAGAVVATLAALAVPAVTRAQPAPARTLDLYVGQAHVINEGPIRRIAVGNGRVMQATALDDRQVLVIPEAPGQSTLHLWGKTGPERVYVVNVVPADASRLLTEIRAMLGDTGNVRARLVGDKIVLEGNNLSEEQAGRLAEIARRYPQIVNLVGRVGLERMIAMDVRMIEIKREVLQNLGVKWNGSAQGPSFGIIGDLQRSAALQPGGAGAGVAGLEVRPRVAPFATTLGLASSITSVVNFLVQRGDAVVLAEPRLSCRSGGTARFVAGGELPLPFSAGLGQVSVVFKEYGVKFDVSPVASETGVIAAKIATEISAINFEVTVRDIPGITKRRAETEVNLREHETLVIAGLLNEESTRNVDKVQGLGDLPILGPLFRSRQFRERQTDLVVFVTPRFVQSDAPTSEPSSEQGAEPPVASALRRAEAARERIRMAE